MEQQILEAKFRNWAILIQEKVERLIKEHVNDIDLSIKVINHDFEHMAQEEFCEEKLKGLWDDQNMWIGG